MSFNEYILPQNKLNILNEATKKAAETQLEKLWKLWSVAHKESQENEYVTNGNKTRT